MLPDEVHSRCAEDLLRAGQTRTAIQQPSRTDPDITVQDAYRIQDLWALERIAQGARLAGYKIGLTSRAMQLALKATEPDYGRMFDDALYEDGALIPTDAFLKPRVEVELAFILGADLEGASTSIDDVIHATESIVPALEIIDSRTEMPRTITDTIADNAAFGAIVTSPRRFRPGDIDIGWTGATLAKNGHIEESGVSASVLGHPAAAVAWLAKALVAAGGKLEKGQLILSGSFIRPVEVKAGDRLHADYGPWGTVSISFI